MSVCQFLSAPRFSARFFVCPTSWYAASVPFAGSWGRVFPFATRFRVPVPRHRSLARLGHHISLKGTLAAYPTKNGKLAACPALRSVLG